MTGSLCEKKGHYYVVANIYDNNGKRKPKWISTGIPTERGNKKKAEAKLREVLNKLENEKRDLCHEMANISFSSFILIWLENIKNNIEPNTYESYAVVINKHVVPYFEKRKIMLHKLTPMHIQEYYNYLINEGRADGKGGLSPNTIKKHHANISKCLNYAMKQNLIAFNPSQRVDLPKTIRFIGNYYNEAETQKLISICKGDPLEQAIILTAFYGLRRSEVLGLKWDAIDFVNKTIKVKHKVVKMCKGSYLAKDGTKNYSSLRTLPLIHEVGSYLSELKANQENNKNMQPNDYINSDYICVHHNGCLFRPDYVSSHFKLLLLKNGLRLIRFHDLRHSAASHLLYLGFSMKEIQEWLGHADIGTTMNTYTHIDVEMKRNIAQRLDETFKIYTEEPSVRTGVRTG